MLSSDWQRSPNYPPPRGAVPPPGYERSGDLRYPMVFAPLRLLGKRCLAAELAAFSAHALRPPRSAHRPGAARGGPHRRHTGLLHGLRSQKVTSIRRRWAPMTTTSSRDWRPILTAPIAPWEQAGVASLANPVGATARFAEACCIPTSGAPWPVTAAICSSSCATPAIFPAFARSSSAPGDCRPGTRPSRRASRRPLRI